jgi:glycosyltransferase (activator-dependent family)
MRVLLCSVPYRTHFYSLVPLAWALRTAGHEVVVASQPYFADTITDAGLTAVSVGHDYDGLRLIKAFDLDKVDGRAAFGMPLPYHAAVMDPDELDWQEMRTGYDVVVHWWHKPLNFPLIKGLVEFCRSWEPDLVVWEPVSYAAPIAAKACGAAHARLVWSIDAFGVARDRYLGMEPPPEAYDGESPDPIRDWLAGYGRLYDFDFSEDMVTGQFTIDPLPAALRMHADSLDYVPMQYVPYGGPIDVPKWLQEPPKRPRVALTLGVSATEYYAGYSVSVAEILDALSDLDIEVIATVTGSERDRLGPVPDNVRIVSYVPLHALAPTCAAVINHAGPGTFLTIARYGVPQLTIPWDFDEPELARRSAVHGGSITLPVEQANGAAVRANLLRLLNEPSFATQAARLREDMFALPSPNDVVPRLEELTAKYRQEATR